ncbi:MAG TPA: phytoene/squalene synthase family protein [Terriglobales bacterium]
MSTAVQPASAQFVPTESQLRVAYSVCRSIARAAAKNFYYAFLVLPKSKRDALCAVYAYMRRCDDIADDSSAALAERRNRLAAWLESLHRVQAGQPTDDPVLLGLTDAQRRFSIPAELLDQLAHGTAMDVEEQVELAAAATPHIQYKSFHDLCFYCYRVASVVGLVCIRVFGYRDPKAEQLAERLGLAFQLTNIIRDVKEDLEMGRIYLPQEDLKKFGVSLLQLTTAPGSESVRALLAAEADRAREFYASADELVHLIDEDSQPALWVLATIYRRLLERIAGQQYDVFKQRVSLTTREKLMILGKGFLKRLV